MKRAYRLQWQPPQDLPEPGEPGGFPEEPPEQAPAEPQAPPTPLEAPPIPQNTQ